MALPPAWKVRRELNRLGKQIANLLVMPLYDRLKQIRYDWIDSASIKDDRGDQPLGDQIAIFVLFQPQGLCDSTIFTMDFLCERGWSVVPVSNAPLSDADMARIRPFCARIIQRPNAGYDFGAYREGVRRLGIFDSPPQRVILMNDSSWFPLRSDDTALDRMVAADTDLAGHVFKFESTQKLGKNHVESHFLMLNAAALRAPYMRAFWGRFVMSDDRERTILRGEKGISQAVMAQGKMPLGLIGRDRFHDLMAGLPEPELRSYLPFIVHHRERDRQFVNDLVARADRGDPWRDDFLEWIYHVLSNSRQHLVTVNFVDPAMRLGGLGFVKKAKDRRSQLGRLAVLRAVELGRIPPLEPVVQREIAQMAAAWTPPPDRNDHPGEPQTAEL